MRKEKLNATKKIVEHKDIREAEVTRERRGGEKVERWRRRLGRG